MTNNKKCDWFKIPVSDDEDLTIVFVNDKSFRVCEAAAVALLGVLDSDNRPGVNDPREKTVRETPSQSSENLAASLLDIDTDSDGLSDGGPTEPSEIDPERPAPVAQQQPQSPSVPLDDKPVEIRLPDNPNAPIPPQSPETVKTIMEQAYKHPPGTLDALTPGKGSRAANERLQQLNKKMSEDMSRQAGNGINFTDNNNVGN